MEILVVFVTQYGRQGMRYPPTMIEWYMNIFGPVGRARQFECARSPRSTDEMYLFLMVQMLVFVGCRRSVSQTSFRWLLTDREGQCQLGNLQSIIGVHQGHGHCRTLELDSSRIVSACSWPHILSDMYFVGPCSKS